MERRLIVLQLALEELGIPLSIETMGNRILMQKGISLSQSAGADLDYRFSWYLRGPYSTDLTKDYYKLMEDPKAVQKEAEQYELRDGLKQALASVKPLLRVPGNVQLTQAEWVELLASLDYALKIQRLSEEKAIEFVSDQKPRLAPYVDQGLKALKSSHLYK